MLSPTASIYGNLAGATSRALAGLQRSVGRALRSADAVESMRDAGDVGQFSCTACMDAGIRVKNAMSGGMQNAVSFAQMQDCYLQFVLRKYERMSVLASQASDPLLSSKDREDLDEEFEDLRGELLGLSLETFNWQAWARASLSFSWQANGLIDMLQQAKECFPE